MAVCARSTDIAVSAPAVHGPGLDCSLLTTERRLDALASAEVHGRGPFWGEGEAEREACLQVSTCSSHASLLAAELSRISKFYLRPVSLPHSMI